MAIPKKAKKELIEDLALTIEEWDLEVLKDEDFEDRVYGKYSQRRPFAGNELYVRMAEAAVAVMEATGEAQETALRDGDLLDRIIS